MPIAISVWPIGGMRWSLSRVSALAYGMWVWNTAPACCASLWIGAWMQ